MNRLLLCSLFLSLVAGTTIEWPFEQKADQNALKFEVAVGNPPQTLQLLLRDETDISSAALDVFDSRIGGNFDFEWLPYVQFGYFGLRRAAADEALGFVESLVQAGDSKTLIVAYKSLNFSLAGSFVIGGQSDLCGSEWSMAAETNYTERPDVQWALSIDELTVDVYTLDSPGQAVFALDDAGLKLPKPIYQKVLSALNATDADILPCNIQTEVVFTINGVDLRLQPADYLDRSEEAATGLCHFQGYRINGNAGFVLPNTLLRRHCLKYDYEQKQVGFAALTTRAFS
ncbi:hypothetical protein M3Y99_00651300 [Aphelenchoides fujianensis]|nr:hypothetical protein M3Y99_00651300 [Aphelenchoides fujianensis]